jgi:hypothetical protein
MSSLDNLLLSDLEVWLTLAILAVATLLLVPAEPVRSGPSRARRGVIVLVAMARLGGLAWYGVPVVRSGAWPVVADSGDG